MENCIYLKNVHLNNNKKKNAILAGAKDTNSQRKLKAFVMRNVQNLFGTDWMEEFDLFNIPRKIDGNTTSSDKLKKELKVKFPEIFSEGLGFFSKVKAKFEVKENVIPVFRPKRPVPRGSVEIIDKELGRLEKLGVIEKTDYHSWAAPTVYVEKKIIKLESAHIIQPNLMIV